MTAINLAQPDPINPADAVALWPQVIAEVRGYGRPVARMAADMEARHAAGLATYGVPLAPHNGRDALRDAYAEALDGVVYLWQAVVECDPADTRRRGELDALYRGALHHACRIRMAIDERSQTCSE